MANQKQGFFENLLSLALAVLLVFMIRSSVVEAFKIPSGSMIPTLLVGDHIFVNKFAYGFKVPFSDLFMDKAMDIISRPPPRRGDIIVFKYPKDESLYYIKRVIGLPGDLVELKNKVVYINHKPMNRTPLAPDKADKILSDLDDPRYSRTSLELYEEDLDGVKHTIMLDKNNFLSENFEPKEVVPPDSLFVMGDNRDFSNDSRFWGFVPFKNVKGKAMIIWLSLWVENITSPSDLHVVFKPNRFLTLLH